MGDGPEKYVINMVPGYACRTCGVFVWSPPVPHRPGASCEGHQMVEYVPVPSSSSVERADDAVFAIRQALAWIEQDKPNMAAHRLQAFLDSSGVPAGERDVSEEDHGPFDADELVRWAEMYGHPEAWAKKAQEAHGRAERAEKERDDLREQLDDLATLCDACHRGVHEALRPERRMR